MTYSEIQRITLAINIIECAETWLDPVTYTDEMNDPLDQIKYNITHSRLALYNLLLRIKCEREEKERCLETNQQKSKPGELMSLDQH